MSDIAWSPEPREVIPELVSNPHATYPKPPTRFATWAEQIEAADFDTLKSWANGGVGQPESD